MIGKQWKSK